MWYWGATGLSHQLFKKLASEFGTVCIRVNTAKEAILLQDTNTLVKVYSDNTPLHVWYWGATGLLQQFYK